MSVIELDMVPSRVEGYDDYVSSQYGPIRLIQYPDTFLQHRAVKVVPNPLSTEALAKFGVLKTSCGSPRDSLAHTFKTLRAATLYCLLLFHTSSSVTSTSF